MATEDDSFLNRTLVLKHYTQCLISTFDVFFLKLIKKKKIYANIEALDGVPSYLIIPPYHLQII